MITPKQLAEIRLTLVEKELDNIEAIIVCANANGKTFTFFRVDNNLSKTDVDKVVDVLTKAGYDVMVTASEDNYRYTVYNLGISWE